jgi:hypothetical protein
VAHVLEALDRERVTVAAALGIRARTALEWTIWPMTPQVMTCTKPFTTSPVSRH